MKIRCLFIYTFLCWSIFLSAQEFTTQIFFEDAAGRKDTLRIGNSPQAVFDELNPALGEYNIPDSEIDTTFFICLTDQLFDGGFFHKAKFRTKTKYVDFSLIQYNYERYLYIDIFCKNFPLKVSWDSALFSSDHLIKSGISMSSPGIWFCAGPNPIFFYKKDSAFFYGQYKPGDDIFKQYFYDVGVYYYDSIQSEKVKIWKLYIGFFDKYAVFGNIDDIQATHASIHPNPCKDYFGLDLKYLPINSVEIFDITGRRVLQSSFPGANTSEKVNVGNLPPGAYIIRPNNQNNNRIKLIKQ